MTRTVGDIMVRRVITINEEDSLAGLMDGMAEYHLRHLPVVNGKRLVGLLTHRDLLRFTTSELEPAKAASGTDQRLKENTFAASVMTRNVATVREGTPLLQAVRMVLANKYGCLPVINEDYELIGIVTEHDLLKELAKDLQMEEAVELGLVANE